MNTNLINLTKRLLFITVAIGLFKAPSCSGMFKLGTTIKNTIEILTDVPAIGADGSYNSLYKCLKNHKSIINFNKCLDAYLQKSHGSVNAEKINNNLAALVHLATYHKRFDILTELADRKVPGLNACHDPMSHPNPMLFAIGYENSKQARKAFRSLLRSNVDVAIKVQGGGECCILVNAVEKDNSWAIRELLASDKFSNEKIKIAIEYAKKNKKKKALKEFERHFALKHAFVGNAKSVNARIEPDIIKEIIKYHAID